MDKQQKFRRVIKRKKQRLEELAQHDLGDRFLHHTVLGIPQRLRSSIPHAIIKYGLLNGKDRNSNPETKFSSSNSWFGDTSPVYLMDDSYNSFRVGSEGQQMMDLIVDPKILKHAKYYQTTEESKDLVDSYDGEIGICGSIKPEYILGAVVPSEGHDELLELQTNSKKESSKLEKQDKERYGSYDGKSLKGTIWEEDESGSIVGEGAFYRGLVWGMKDFPENAFPIFTGFSSSHFPYKASNEIWSGERATKDNEIPFEYYLAGQIFPLTPEAYAGQVFRDIAERRGVSPRQFGLGVRCGKGLITPEQALNRDLTKEESRIYATIAGGRR